MQLYKVEREKKSNFPKYLAVIIITVIVTLFVNKTIGEANRIDEFAERLSLEENQIQNNQILSKTEDMSSDIEDVLESTVGISLLKPTGESIFDIDVAQKWGIGTGVIVSEKGYILTNQHLAKEKGARIAVTLNSGKTIQGKIVWVEENIDLAIIKVDENGLIPAILGSSDDLKIGNDVIAIGNPLGAEFQGTTTKGIVSGLDRTIKFDENGEQVFMEGLIQTDASINPGNSGGPLINSKGEVIGINTIKITSAEGIGFAVPIDIVKNVINSFVLEDNFEEAYLGLYAYDSEAIKYMNTKNSFDRGIYVVSVDEEGPCGKMGIKKGDIITKIDGVEINKMTELREYLYSKRPGDKISLTVENSEHQTLEIELRKKNITKIFSVNIYRIAIYLEKAFA